MTTDSKQTPWEQLMQQTGEAWMKQAKKLEYENSRLGEALELIARWPITDPKNMDAMSMQAIAKVVIKPTEPC